MRTTPAGGKMAECSHQIISPIVIQILSVNLKSRRHGFPAPSARFPAALECVSSSSSFPQSTDRNPSFSTVWLQSCRFYNGNPFKVFKKKTPNESHGWFLRLPSRHLWVVLAQWPRGRGYFKPHHCDRDWKAEIEQAELSLALFRPDPT